MGYSIALCETECSAASCREHKLHITKIFTNDKCVEFQKCDEVVENEDARKAVGDWDAFLSRNRLNEQTNMVYMSKVKKEDDIAALKPYVKKVPNGWVYLDEVTEEQKKQALEEGDMENTVTAWQDADFDVSEVCSKCPLSWDKGRGCIGELGPEKTKLPEIAAKVGCEFVANIPKYAKEKKVFKSEDAKAILKEVEILRPALVADGKLAVRRYSGVLDRLEAMAKVCIEYDCGFHVL